MTCEQLSNLYNEMIMSRYLNCCLHIQVSSRGVNTNFRYFLIWNFNTFWTVVFDEIQDCADSTSSILTRPHLCGIFIVSQTENSYQESKLRALGMLKEIRWGNLIRYQKRSVLSNEKFAGISLWNTKGTILKKINASFTIHFCLCRYSLSFGNFEHTSNIIEIRPKLDVKTKN